VPTEVKDDHERPAILRYLRVRNTMSWDDDYSCLEIRAGKSIQCFIWEGETVELKKPFNVGNKVLFLNSRIWRSRASFVFKSMPTSPS
jgi:hypothetical protein